MARRRKGEPVHGWLAVDKPAGLSSAAAVAIARRALGAEKAGHGGTLDPLATGLLPIAFGEATKTVAYVMNGLKTYRFTIRWGEERSTDDAEGKVTTQSAIRPSRAEIEAQLPEFTGRILQAPPAYSAIKVDGRRAYELARTEGALELAKRPVEILSFRLLELPDPDHAVFEVASGKGAYMRSLARDLSRRLGTVGHVAALRRVAIGPFREEQAISLERLVALGHSAAAFEALHPIGTVLDDIPALALSGEEADRLRRGQAIALLKRSDLARVQRLEDGATVFATCAGRPVALTRFQAGSLRPVRVLNL
ncbi:MAG TPA: tRNA pseudouridine(55) synthase TruB [Alphaproteobacteria bacterium]|nr:tRNA pseudouridine(55) synthase TruB [Alphaproteobacteria bacterium]